jgi:hypothetical protein
MRRKDMVDFATVVSQVSAARYVPLRAAVAKIQQGDLPAAWDCIRAAHDSGAGSDRQSFTMVLEAAKHTVWSAANIVPVPVSTDSDERTVVDITVAVKVAIGATNAVPMFFERGSPGRGLGPCSGIVFAYILALVKMGVLQEIDGYYWPVLPGGPEEERGLNMMFALGYMLGYSVVMGISIPRAIAPAVICLSLSHEGELPALHTLPDHSRRLIKQHGGAIEFVRAGMQRFAHVLRPGRWTPQKIYEYCFDRRSAAPTLLAHRTDMLDASALDPAQSTILRQWLESLDQHSNAAFIFLLTDASELPDNGKPLSVRVYAPPAEVGMHADVVVSTCNRSVEIPALWFSSLDMFAQKVGAVLADVHYNTL